MEVYTNCKKMLLARGYEITFEGTDKILATKPDKGIVTIFFSHIPKLNINTIKEYLGYLGDEGMSHAIVIFKSCITPSAKKNSGEFI